jgi:GDP-L-fucose synthase
LNENGFQNLIFTPFPEYDLRDQQQAQKILEREKPEYVFLAAAKVGGIVANSTYPAEFIYDNVMIAFNVIHACYGVGVKKLINLGSSCIYPRLAPQPLKETELLTSPLESTNEAYAVAKIAAIKLCRYYNKQYGTNFISAMPTNLYGPGDNFDLETSHVIPGMIRKFHEAKIKKAPYTLLWGTGSPKREFMYVDDLADALLFLMNEVDVDDTGEIINIGTGNDLTIRQLAELIKKTVGYTGEIRFDKSKPDGTPRKLLDVSRMTGLGWKAKTELSEGVKRLYKWYVEKC